MKRILLFIAILSLLFMPISGMALGTAPSTCVRVTKDVHLLTYSWTADASAADVPATASISGIDGYVILVITNPGDTAPTALYDITLTDADDIDVMGGELADRSATLSEHAVPKIDTVFGGRWISGLLTLNISNNLVNSATGVVKVYIQR